MYADSPVGGRVPLPREEIAPVLEDEPAAEQRRGLGRSGYPDELGDEEQPVRREHRQPELVLVDALPEHVAAGAKIVALDFEHPTKSKGEEGLVGAS